MVRKYLVLLFTLMFLFSLGLPSLFLPATHREAHAEVLPVENVKNMVRYSGSNRYATAVEISKNNWAEAQQVVLARGDAFPDALTGSVLASSPLVSGPLLLTETDALRPEVIPELARLHTQTVYLLGGTGAISSKTEQQLQGLGYGVVRLEGKDRYDTAGVIARTAIGSYSGSGITPASPGQAFVVSGVSFADALSVSAVAAGQGIPLLLTAKQEVPQATLQALQDLKIQRVTLVGGEGAIGAGVAAQLTQAGYQVERLAGSDRFATNTAVLNHFQYNLDQVVVATGMSFPDALAASVLAAEQKNPLMLLPQDAWNLPGSSTELFLQQHQATVQSFLIAGGTGAVSYKTESYLRDGKLHDQISLQFWDGYGVLSRYESTLATVPGRLTDHIDVLVPNFAGEMKADGSFAYSFPTADVPKYLVSLGQSRGAKVVPMILADGSLANAMLLDEAKRGTFLQSTLKLVQETDADGVLIDLEALADNTQTGLTTLMRDLYTILHPQGKMVMISVMSRTSATAEPWYAEYNYAELAKYADYIQIMSYDKHWATSAPGPIAPLDWVGKVMSYAVTQIPREKILMGVPYYGRAWRQTGTGWTSTAFGLARATEIAAQYGATITRERTAADPVGIPTFQYTDASGVRWTAYYDDRLSWQAKFSLAEQYGLGGIGSWSMGWINSVSAGELYPLLRERS